MTDSRIAVAHRSKVANALLFNLGAIGIGMAVVLFVLFDLAITRSFTELEDKEVAAHMARLEDFKASNLQTIETRTKDWANWDDTYFYARTFGEDYEIDNLNPSSFENAEVDGQVVVQAATGEMRSHAYDRTAGEPDPQLAVALADFVRQSNLSGKLRRMGAVRGFIAIDGVLYLMGAANIRRNDGTGESPGYMVFVQHIDGEQATQSLQVPAAVTFGSHAPPAGVVRDYDRIVITSPINDVSGEPIGAVTLRVKRPPVGRIA